MPNGSPPPHRPLGRTLTAVAGVIGLAFLGAVVVYFATAGLLYLRSDFCDGGGSSIWCRKANIAKLPDLLKGQNAHKRLTEARGFVPRHKRESWGFVTIDCIAR
jgi:hypothetical protein